MRRFSIAVTALLMCTVVIAEEPAAVENTDRLAVYQFTDEKPRTLAELEGRMVAVWGLCKGCGDHTPEHWALVKAAVERRNAERRPIVFIILATPESLASAQEGLASQKVAVDEANGVLLAVSAFKGPELRRQSAVFGSDGAATRLRFRDLGTTDPALLPSPVAP